MKKSAAINMFVIIASAFFGTNAAAFAGSAFSQLEELYQQQDGHPGPWMLEKPAPRQPAAVEAKNSDETRIEGIPIGGFEIDESLEPKIDGWLELQKRADDSAEADVVAHVQGCYLKIDECSFFLNYKFPQLVADLNARKIFLELKHGEAKQLKEVGSIRGVDQLEIEIPGYELKFEPRFGKPSVIAVLKLRRVQVYAGSIFGGGKVLPLCLEISTDKFYPDAPHSSSYVQNIPFLQIGDAKCRSLELYGDDSRYDHTLTCGGFDLDVVNETTFSSEHLGDAYSTSPRDWAGKYQLHEVTACR